jgi:hypothetical protein
MEPGVLTETDAERVERWRRRVLREAGYDRESAQVLAICADVDLHQAVMLLRSGCCQKLALEILL